MELFQAWLETVGFNLAAETCFLLFSILPVCHVLAFNAKFWPSFNYIYIHKSSLRFLDGTLKFWFLGMRFTCLISLFNLYNQLLPELLFFINSDRKYFRFWSAVWYVVISEESSKWIKTSQQNSRKVVCFSKWTQEGCQCYSLVANSWWEVFYNEFWRPLCLCSLLLLLVTSFINNSCSSLGKL